MIKNFLVLFFGFASLSMFSQEIANASEIEKKLAKVNVDALGNKLLLTVNQKEKMMEVVTLYEMSKNKIFKSDSEIDDKNKKLQDLEKNHHDKIAEVLSEKQLQKFNALVQDVKAGG